MSTSDIVCGDVHLQGILLTCTISNMNERQGESGLKLMGKV